MFNSPDRSYESKENINERFKKRLKDIKMYFVNIKNTYGIDFVLSDELENIDFENIQIVLVGDNPGEKELKNNEFFSQEGIAGKMARDLFNLVYGENSFANNVLVLNKTLFHTNRTHQLKNNNGTDLLEESQIIMANFLMDFLKEKKVPVIIVGFSEMEGFFRPYFNILKEKGAELKISDSIFVSPHFSMSKIFCKHKNIHWNTLIDLFIEKYPYLGNEKGNISSKAFYITGNNMIFKDFLEMVILKQRLSDY